MSRGGRYTGTMLMIAAAMLVTGSVCWGHPAQLVAADVKIRADGHFSVVARFDVLAFALNDTPARIGDPPMNQLLDGPADALKSSLDDARVRFMHGFRVRCNGQAAPLRAVAIQFPQVSDVYRWRDAGMLPRLPVLLETHLEGQLPPGTRDVAFRFPDVMGTVVLSIERAGLEPYSEPVEAGRYSSTLPVSIERSGAASHQPSPSVAAAAEPGKAEAAFKFLLLGFTHILPRGPDHILFVLGLFLLSTKLRPLLWQVSSFTVAHSITLGLALYGVLRLPAAVVEPLIALSIAFVAIENLFTTDLKPWRPIVVFGFGLVHGMGFAGVLMGMGLARSQFATALLTFNIGVELGQLCVIAMALVAVGWWRRREWYRGAIVLPASTAIAAIAIFWTVQRLL